METIDHNNIVVQCGIDFIAIHHLQLNIKMNDHATLTLSGTVKNGYLDEYQRKDIVGDSIKIYYIQDEEEISLFYGTIQIANFRYEGDYGYITLDGISNSYKFDQLKKCRSFQNIKQTYGQLLGSLGGANGSVIPIKGRDKKIPYPLIQYKETDWDFLLRLAGHFHTVLVPEVTGQLTQVAFGVPHGEKYDLNFITDYRVKRLNGRCDKQPVYKYQPSDLITYTVVCNLNMNLGDKVLFKGHQWIVLEKNLCFKQELLEMEYVLGSEYNCGIAYHDNSKLKGISLTGIVLWTGAEKIKLHLSIDEDQKIKEAYEYCYMPNTGNIMYSMPEKGATASLYFPNSSEASGIVINAIRDKSKEYPNSCRKSLSTPHKKRIGITPTDLMVETYQTEGESQMRISDKAGFFLSSELPVQIIGGNEIEIQSQGSISVMSSCYMLLSQTGTGNRVELAGNDIVLEAERFSCSARERKSLEHTVVGIKDEPLVSANMCGTLMGALPVGGGGQEAKVTAGIPMVCSTAGSVNGEQCIGWKVGN